LDVMERVLDGATDRDVYFVTMRDGLENMVLAETAAGAPQSDASAKKGQNHSLPSKAVPVPLGPGGQVVVFRSSDRSAPGIGIYEWGLGNGVAHLLVSPIPAAATRSFIEQLLGLNGR